jgi:LysM domain
MALRREDLDARRDAVVVTFPVERTRGPDRRRRRRATLRRRLVLGGVPLVIVTMMLLGGGSAPASKTATPRAITLGPGDTLWDLAERYAPPSVDTRAFVDAVIELNELSGMPQAGMRLLLPQ